ncbi:MAG: ATP-binding cassette domain-containing protein [Chlamydiia bacterium]|nr:ATP-binding cassette domain-containing protein [Chlamydiia bacterium]
MLQVKNLLYKHTRTSPPFFENLNFSLEKGKIHALFGKNGVGKTVLLNVLSNKHPLNSTLIGEIENKGVVLVNQRFDEMIVDQFTFLENLRFAKMGRFPNPIKNFKKDIDLPKAFLPFHISLSTPAYQLSGGQRQILALLMTLQQEVHILLLDEPTAALDVDNAKMVFEFLKRLPITQLVVCHDRELVRNYVTGKEFFLTMDVHGVRRLTNV